MSSCQLASIQTALYDDISSSCLVTCLVHLNLIFYPENDIIWSCLIMYPLHRFLMLLFLAFFSMLMCSFYIFLVFTMQVSDLLLIVAGNILIENFFKLKAMAYSIQHLLSFKDIFHTLFN